tara:strand:+ start:506 stop:676 length:171 start_codon:yes stop_codon:yes gene_type:complete
MKKKEKMTQEELIGKYVLPSECKENIILYMEGSLGYDEDYLREVADDNHIQLIETN